MAELRKSTVGKSDARAGAIAERSLSRREILVAALSAAVAFPNLAAAKDPSRKPKRPPLPPADWRRLPRWRGFNLVEKANLTWTDAGQPYRQWDFDFIAKHGFNFVRLPLDYRFWTPSAGGSEAQLRDIDRAMALAAKRRIHVNLAFFNVPGHVDSGPAEPAGRDLWAEGHGGDEARRLFAEQWSMLADRYKGIPSTRLSFNLLNEPSGSIFALDRAGQHAAYVRALTPAVAAIRGVRSDRLLIADAQPPWAVVKGFPRTVEGFEDPVPELFALELAQSFHCYLPALLAQYGAIEGSSGWPVPTWPYVDASPDITPDWVLPGPWDITRVKEILKPWLGVKAAGVGVHAGEFGCYNQTPHSVTLAWMRDILGLFRELGVGWALWNLRGSFGVAESGRKDVAYATDHGYAVDRQMLILLKNS